MVVRIGFNLGWIGGLNLGRSRRGFLAEVILSALVEDLVWRGMLG